MAKQRKEDQAVDAFSAPRDLLKQAHLAAKARGMTKSGFYRYCLVKELGLGEAAAMKVAEHASVGNFNIISSPGTTQVFSSAAKPAQGSVTYKKGGGKKKGKS